MVKKKLSREDAADLSGHLSTLYRLKLCHWLHAREYAFYIRIIEGTTPARWEICVEDGLVCAETMSEFGSALCGEVQGELGDFMDIFCDESLDDAEDKLTHEILHKKEDMFNHIVKKYGKQ